jgi:hypothetical protein
MCLVDWVCILVYTFILIYTRPPPTQSLCVVCVDECKPTTGAILREQLRPDILLLNTGLWKAIKCVIMCVDVVGNVCVGVLLCAYIRMCICGAMGYMGGADQKPPNHDPPPPPTHRHTLSHSHTNREGPQLDALVSAATDLAASSSTDVYWKSTTSRAIGAVWVRGGARMCVLFVRLVVVELVGLILPN